MLVYAVHAESLDQAPEPELFNATAAMAACTTHRFARVIRDVLIALCIGEIPMETLAHCTSLIVGARAQEGTDQDGIQIGAPSRATAQQGTLQ